MIMKHLVGLAAGMILGTVLYHAVRAIVVRPAATTCQGSPRPSVITVETMLASSGLARSEHGDDLTGRQYLQRGTDRSAHIKGEG